MPTRTVRHHADVMRLIRRALESGGYIAAPRRVQWDASAGCDQPWRVTFEGRASVDLEFRDRPTPVIGYHGDGDRQPVWLDMDVPCRKCGTCLKRRAAGWAGRARLEVQRSTRTWFGTLTLSPRAHLLMAMRARARLRSAGVRFDELPPADQFVERHRESSRELTLWLKRVRKESGAPLRFVLVAEAHKSGLPHYHLLLHEVSQYEVVTERLLRRQWRRYGLSQFTLVNDARNSSWYVCKYLSKAALTRVRASLRYGRETLLENRAEPVRARF